MVTSDEALCRRVAEGDEAAFDLLVARHQGRAYRLAWSLLRDAEDAREASQDAFLRLYQSAATFRGGARFTTWFFRIVVNQCLDRRRRDRWWRRFVVRDARRDGDTPEVVEREPATAAAQDRALEDAELSTRLWRAVETLSPQQRAAIVLQAQEGLATADIAAVLDCSEATVRVHLHRAVTTLRKTMKREDR